MEPAENTWQDFAHHQPRNRTETEREADDVNNEGTERQPADLRDVIASVLVVEEGSKCHQCDDHRYAGNVKQNLSAESINQNGRDESGNEVDHADNDRAQVLVDGAAGVFEDGHGVENDGVDTRQLLEEHQAQRDGQRLQIAAFQQLKDGVLWCMAFGLK